MRFAVISDIHSNLEALTEVLRSVEAQKVDRVVSLGDIVGYGASPNECCRLVRSVAEVTLLGNHDAAVAGRMDYSFYYEGARHALDWSAEVLNEENHAWLRSLPGTLSQHGSDLRAVEDDRIGRQCRFRWRIGSCGGLPGRQGEASKDGGHDAHGPHYHNPPCQITVKSFAVIAGVPSKVAKRTCAPPPLPSAS